MRCKTLSYNSICTRVYKTTSPFNFPFTIPHSELTKILYADFRFPFRKKL